MRSNAFWSFISFGVTFGLARLGMIWTQGHEWVGPWLAAGCVLSFGAAVIILILPFFARILGLTASERETASLHNVAGSAAAIAQHGSTITQNYIGQATISGPAYPVATNAFWPDMPIRELFERIC